MRDKIASLREPDGPRQIEPDITSHRLGWNAAIDNVLEILDSNTVAPYRDKAESEMCSSWEQRFDCANCVKNGNTRTIAVGDSFCARCGAKVDWSQP